MQYSLLVMTLMVGAAMGEGPLEHQAGPVGAGAPEMAMVTQDVNDERREPITIQPHPMPAPPPPPPRMAEDKIPTMPDDRFGYLSN